jgi:cbb3-type cytochrome oxidase maturation protein
MATLLILIPITVLLTVIAVFVFLWAVNNDQFEGLDRHGFDIFEDKPGDRNQ